MRCLERIAAAILLASLAPLVNADGLVPGSVLVYPVHRSGYVSFNVPPSQTPVPMGSFFTVLAVTNTNLVPATPLNGLGGSTNVHYEFVNAQRNPQNDLEPLSCNIVNRVEFLTPGDTLVMLSNCPNPPLGREGYLVITAQDPNAFDRNWSHNYLVGSELVFQGSFAYALNAIPFEAIPPDGQATDLDLDGEVDFDGVEYEPVPDHLYLDWFATDTFLQSIALINLSGSFDFRAQIAFDVFNDNEQPLSATASFRCWADEFLADLGGVFAPGFLAANMQNDPTEWDLDCNGTGDLETGWARVRGVTNSSAVESYPDPAILVAFTRNVVPAYGKRVWESEAVQTNGDFLKTGTDDVEFP